MVYAVAGFARRIDGLGDGAVRAAFLADLYEVLPAASTWRATSSAAGPRTAVQTGIATAAAARGQLAG